MVLLIYGCQYLQITQEHGKFLPQWLKFKIQCQKKKIKDFLFDRQREEMEDAMKNAGTKYTDAQVNQLAQRHIDNSQVCGPEKGLVIWF